MTHNTAKKSKQLRLQLIVACFLVVLGAFLLVSSFYCPPIGIIHSSVLTAYGEISTFSGALFGIDCRYKYREYREFREYGKQLDRSDQNNEKQ